MANTPKIHVEGVRSSKTWRITFPQIEGLAGWAIEELGAKFTPATVANGRAVPWHYSMPATSANATKIYRTAPLPIDGCELWESILPNIAKDLPVPDYFGDKILDQPAKRVRNLWRHQLGGFHYLKSKSGIAMMSMGMGTGKSYTLISYLLNEPKLKTCLILCPSAVLGVWRGQFAEYAPEVPILILDPDVGNGKEKVKLADRWLANEFDGLRVVVCNFESARIEPLKTWFLKRRWDVSVLDESHRCKDPTGVTGKFTEKLRNVSARRICLTGTPMPHSPADIFSQYRFLNPNLLGTSFVRFKRRYAIAGFFNEVIGWRRKEELSRIFHSAAYEVSSDVLDLPSVQHIEREFTLPKESLAIYKALWLEMVAEVKGGACSVDNALVKLIRAQQITSGFLPLDQNTGEDVQQVAELNTAKADLLAEILKDIAPSETVVVFAKHTRDLRAIEATAEKLGRVYGEVSGSRNDLTSAAKIPEGIQVFGAQIKSGGVGVDFTRSCFAVLYSIDFSLGNYDQMLARLVRPGQKRPVVFVKLIAKGTVDRRIYNALQERREVVESVVEAIHAGKV